MKEEKEIDGYQIFYDEMNIKFEKIIKFGEKYTININDNSIIEKQWKNIKKILKNQSSETLYFRAYGKTLESNNLQKDLLKYLFPKANLECDTVGNKIPRKNIENKLNGVKYVNFQCSHVFGKTQNPILFEILWNITLIPKIVDPLTGHESTGENKKLFEQNFKNIVYKKYKKYIKEYNKFLSDENIEKKIQKYKKEILEKKKDFKNNSKKYNRFITDMIKYWSAIDIER